MRGLANPSAGTGLTKTRYRRAPRPLDTLPAPSAAYGMRRLLSSYTGPCLRVRRGLDNTEQDIGFTTAGNLDTTALWAFVGSENQMAQSNAFSTTPWATTSTTVVQNASGPAGIESLAWTLSRTITGNSCYFGQPYTKTAGAQLCVSMYAKAGTARYLSFRIQGAYPAISDAAFDLTAGTVSTAAIAYNGFSGASAGIVPVGGGWYRCWLSAVTDSSTGYQFYMSPHTSSTILDDADASASAGLLIAGAQANLGATPQPYTATVTTPNPGNGYVRTWYDQSGNSNNATQATVGSQPQVLVGGVYQDAVYLPATSTRHLLMSTGLTSWVGLAVGSIEGNGNFTRVIHRSTSTTDYPVIIRGVSSASPDSIGFYQGTDVSSPGTWSAGRKASLFSDFTAATPVYALDASAPVAASAPYGGQRQIGSIGDPANPQQFGKINEVIIWPSLTPAQRAAVQADQARYFGFPIP